MQSADRSSNPSVKPLVAASPGVATKGIGRMQVKENAEQRYDPELVDEGRSPHRKATGNEDDAKQRLSLMSIESSPTGSSEGPKAPRETTAVEEGVAAAPALGLGDHVRIPGVVSKPEF